MSDRFVYNKENSIKVLIWKFFFSNYPAFHLSNNKLSSLTITQN